MPRLDRLRTGVYTFECPNSIATVLSNTTQVHMRRPFILPHAVKRFRVHFRNHDQLGDANASSTLTTLTVGIGTPARTTNNEVDLGKCTGALTSVQTATSLANGYVEVVTPWISPSTFKIDPFKTYLLSYAFTSGGHVAAGGGLTWSFAGAGAVADVLLATPSNALTRNSSYGLLHVWIEYEFADNGAPIFVILGNSRSWNSVLGVDGSGELGVWPTLVALRERGCALNLSAGGMWAAHLSTPFGPGNRFNVFDTCAVAPEIDYVVMAEMCSSDMNTDQGAAAYANQMAAFNNARTKWPNARFVMTNLGPRQEFTGDRATTNTMEYARLEVGRKLSVLSGTAVEQVVNVDTMLSDNANPARILFPINGDGTHGNSQYQAQLAAQMVVIKRKDL